MILTLYMGLESIMDPSLLLLLLKCLVCYSFIPGLQYKTGVDFMCPPLLISIEHSDIPITLLFSVILN